MKFKKIYELIIENGIAQDPRGRNAAAAQLKKLKKEYEQLPEAEKKGFDLERLVNPYSDTRILNGTGEEEIGTVLIGIDIDVGELLLAERLREKGTSVDAVISHHPEGGALAGLHRVMYMQADIVNLRGVPVNIAEDIMRERISEVERKVLPVNHTKVVDAARLLEMPFLCVHTPADNHVSSFLQKLFDREKPETVGGIVDLLNDIPEYRQAQKHNAGVLIVNGTKTARPGKIFVDMTGGTEGAKDMFKNLAHAGTGTIVGMHMSEEHLKKAKEEHINVVIAGHISSDTLGLNLLLDAVEKKDKNRLKIIPCSGFTRFRRI